MTHHPDLLDDATLLKLFDPWRDNRRWLVAYSGGIDSSVLLHLCERARRALAANHGIAPELLALHVDHGLSPSHREWAQHCSNQCAALGIECIVERAPGLSTSSGNGGPENTARDARYAIFRRHLHENDALMLAHHQEDQGETLLYRLMRGCGIRGATAIPGQRKLGRGVIARPLLTLPRAALQAYADSAGIDYVCDESNSDTRFDRNFLRHEILPLLKQRWPGAASSLARFAANASDHDRLATDLAAMDFEQVAERSPHFGISLATDKLLSLPQHRRFNLYFYCLKLIGIDPARRLRFEEIDSMVCKGRSGAQLSIGVYSLRIHQQHLYFVADRILSDIPRNHRPQPWHFESEGAALGTLRCRRSEGTGLLDQQYYLGLRPPTARQVRVNGQGKSLKKMLQELGIPSWLRDVAPILYTREDEDAPFEVAAIAGLLVCDGYSGEGGWKIDWHCHESNALQVALQAAGH